MEIKNPISAININNKSPVMQEKLPGTKPKMAGNRSFKLHNRLRFARTSARREIGKANRT